MTSRAQITKTLLLALAPLAACGRTEDEITDWKLLAKGGAAGAAGKAGAGGGTSKAGASGTAGAAGTGGKAAAGSSGIAGAAGSAGASGGAAGAGAAASFTCLPGITMPFGFETLKRCFEPFEGGCPEIGLGIVQADPPDFCGITCQFGGPVPAEPGDPGKCCYLVEQVCEGRPLFVGGHLVTARLARSTRWT